MKLKAKVKWCNEWVVVKPIWFCWRVGMQYKVLTGYKSASIFTDSYDEFYFPIQSKIVLLFVRLAYWCRMWLWMQIRYWQPRKIKMYFKKQSELPF